MALDPSVIQILVDTGQAPKLLSDLQSALASNEQKVQALSQAYAQGTKSLDAFAEEARSLATVQNDLKASADTVGKAMSGVSVNAKGLGQAVLGSSNALQDFISAGGGLGQKLGSVSNNVAQIVTGFAGFGPQALIAASALQVFVAALGGALNAAGIKSFSDLFNLFETKHPFPKQADDVNSLKDSLERAKKEFKALGDQSSGTAAQIARYNALRKEISETEKQIADQQERQKRIQDALTAPSKEQKERGSAFQESLEGQGTDILGDLQKAVAQQSEYEIAADRARATKAISAKIDSGASEQELNQFVAEEEKRHAEYAKTLRTGLDTLAQELFDKALQGEKEAERRVLELAEGGYTGSATLTKFAARVRERNPEGEAKKKADKEAKEAQEKADREAEQELNRSQTQYEQQVTQAAAPFEQGAARDQIRKQILEGAARGQSEQQVVESLRGPISSLLRAAGVDPQLLGDVVKKVLDDEVRKTRGVLAAKSQELAAGGAPAARPEAARAVLATPTTEQRAAETQAESDKQAQVKELVGFGGGVNLQQFAALLAENQRRLLIGAPVAQTPRQAAAYERQGREFALAPEAAEQHYGAQLGRKLAATGADADVVKEAVQQTIEAARSGIANALQSPGPLDEQAEAARRSGAPRQVQQQIDRQNEAAKIANLAASSREAAARAQERVDVTVAPAAGRGRRAVPKIRPKLVRKRRPVKPAAPLPPSPAEEARTSRRQRAAARKQPRVTVDQPEVQVVPQADVEQPQVQVVPEAAVEQPRVRVTPQADVEQPRVQVEPEVIDPAEAARQARRARAQQRVQAIDGDEDADVSRADRQRRALAREAPAAPVDPAVAAQQARRARAQSRDQSRGDAAPLVGVAGKTLQNVDRLTSLVENLQNKVDQQSRKIDATVAQSKSLLRRGRP